MTALPAVSPTTAAAPVRDDPLEHARYQIGNARLLTYPFEHLYVEDVFTPEHYAAMVKHFPDAASFQALSELFPNRGSIELTNVEALRHLPAAPRRFWQGFLDDFTRPAFVEFVLDRYGAGIAHRFRRRIAPLIFLFRDDGQYEITPHTDVVSKVVTMLFYMPTGDAPESLGTSIVVPRDDDFRHDHTSRAPWDAYRSARTVPFRANSMLSFLVTDRSLHAVRPLPAGAVRTSLQYFLVVSD